MSDPGGTQNRRQFSRAKTCFLIAYKVDSPLSFRLRVSDEEVDAQAADVSEGGLAVLTSIEIPVGTQITVKFILSNEAAENLKDRLRSVDIAGRITYCLAVREKQYRMGIQFGDISPADRTFIADFVKAYLAGGNQGLGTLLL